MTSQLLIRIDTDLKNRFKACAKKQGLSMDFILNSFIKAYLENPEMFRVEINLAKIANSHK